jgi:hypothetical protein
MREGPTGVWQLIASATSFDCLPYVLLLQRRHFGDLRDVVLLFQPLEELGPNSGSTTIAPTIKTSG